MSACWFTIAAGLAAVRASHLDEVTLTAVRA
jgi:hypothetical protein